MNTLLNRPPSQKSKPDITTLRRVTKRDLQPFLLRKSDRLSDPSPGLVITQLPVALWISYQNEILTPPRFIQAPTNQNRFFFM